MSFQSTRSYTAADILVLDVLLSIIQLDARLLDGKFLWDVIGVHFEFFEHLVLRRFIKTSPLNAVMTSCC